METQCVRIKLKPNVLDKVRAWAAEINSRSSEVYAILQREGVTIECAFLDEIGGDHYLIYFMKAESLKRSVEVAQASTESLDQFHKQFKKECWDGVSKLELLIDLDINNRTN